MKFSYIQVSKLNLFQLVFTSHVEGKEMEKMPSVL